ncbi:VCBS repeat-containing protein [Dyadobacter sandarakinus]|uniref:VCBS repeat-containing protein n=1 Tax=Dyadobacter sandarakinus TaxID=2747268 RepID=A0ABX7I3Q1_9BACT|nr:VCBS repeat-containing protein [Dyadobacter sandarakinus]QRR00692.1 VCBS repeat-containing protein [Dyadobacter sandarakinus]
MLLLDTFACRRKGDTLFYKLSPDETGIHFANNIAEGDTINAFTYYYCYNGGGVGIADFNNDQLPDILFTGNMVTSRLYLNKGNMQFEDITVQAGLTTSDWIMGVSVVDINHDGFTDIYLNVAGPRFAKKHHNLLYVNQKNLTFREEAAAYGLNDSSFCVQSAFLDYDRDGDLDMYLLTNEVDEIEKTMIIPAGFPITRGKTADQFYENVGDTLGHPMYKNVSVQAGVRQEGYGLGLAVGDLNQDGWPDVYASNDFMPNDQLLINQRNKTFRESARESLRHQTYNGMGVDIEDINNDARPDIMVMDMLPENNERRKTMIAKADYEKFFLRQKAGYVDQYMRNTLQLNQGTSANGTTYFSEIGQLTGMQATDWSWGVLLADYDNDGLRDAYITNGFVKDITDLDFLAYNTDHSMFGTNEVKANRTRELLSMLKSVKLSNYMYRNKGNLDFENNTTNWGLKYDSFSNGAAYADLDNDGDLDLVVSNINEEAFVFENTSIKQAGEDHYLQMLLSGSPKNPAGIGAAITLYCGNDRFYHYFSPVKGYLSSMSGPLHAGLGKHASIDSLRVIWPDGKSQLMTSVQADQRLTLNYQQADDAASPAGKAADVVFSNANDTYDVHWKHTENEFNDFVEESLLMAMYSRKGPGIAVADADQLNGTDFFIGGAAGLPGTLFRQTKSGTFEHQQILEDDARFEDAGSLFFDADGDGDQDLYIVSGGSEFSNQPGAYTDRLYLNDGKGHFTKNGQALPATTSSGSCVAAADFDKDGDLDLFRAGAVLPGEYPGPPRSYLLTNHAGKFTDATEMLAPALLHAGMINAAVWTDFNNDGWTDLIVTGEWMAPVFLKNQKGKLTDVTAQTGLQNMHGWWSSIYPADLDNDGDTDYVLGNVGDNIDYRPSHNEPLELYYADFAGNGRPKPVMTRYMTNAGGDKESFPLSFRDDLFRTMPVLKKKFNTYEPFSRAKLDDIFSKDLVSGAKHYTAETFRSCILINKGSGKFEMKALPAEAQFSCIFGILPLDADADGNLDLLLTGNSHSNEVVYGFMDASVGILLKGDGKGNFRPLPAEMSGVFLSGATRGIGMLYDSRGRQVVLATANADSLNILTNRNRHLREVIRAKPEDVYAEITFKNGVKRKQEFNYGAGYLSQQERAIGISDGIRSVLIFDKNGKNRQVYSLK